MVTSYAAINSAAPREFRDHGDRNNPTNVINPGCSGVGPLQPDSQIKLRPVPHFDIPVLLREQNHPYSLESGGRSVMMVLGQLFAPPSVPQSVKLLERCCSSTHTGSITGTRILLF
ncbi:hypothetical protein SAMN05216403_1211 [Nitrosospira multiformis ATCC 25196]|uniref:Uncharacterized protein n=1 Tax=Nitrosospira multiformis (strain ATCC 25196 / NCIMB 11849 / C 71) TaxID=323848 RepID=A0A1H5WL28_NITMU|nr:hypothetical protein SAMN05216403_1211 [Nitrosospira multiformis ATCC 25196]